MTDVAEMLPPKHGVTTYSSHFHATTEKIAYFFSLVWFSYF